MLRQRGAGLAHDGRTVDDSHHRNVAGGTEYTTYTLTDTGAAPCTLIGCPGVSVLDPQGRAVQRAAVRNPKLATAGARTGLVTLTPGGTAPFIVSSVDTDPDPAFRGVRSGVELRVHPPNQTVALGQRERVEACGSRISVVFRPGG